MFDFFMGFVAGLLPGLILCFTVLGRVQTYLNKGALLSYEDRARFPEVPWIRGERLDALRARAEDFLVQLAQQKPAVQASSSGHQISISPKVGNDWHIRVSYEDIQAYGIQMEKISFYFGTNCRYCLTYHAPKEDSPIRKAVQLLLDGGIDAELDGQLQALQTLQALASPPA